MPLMLIIHVFRWLLLAAEIIIALPICYLSVLSCSAIITAKKRKARQLVAQRDAMRQKQEAPLPHFAILIPAHNEEAILHNLLESLDRLSYPQECYSICVVADNCIDGTAALARASEKARVYERYDSSKRGKGYALRWLLEKLAEDTVRYDACIILDADSVVEPTFLLAMAREMQQGAQAMQACNTVLNTAESASAALRLIAMTLVNHLRPLGRNGLGASSTLTGNGMCLSRDLLERYPWRAFALAEDYQYYLTLVQHGERVRYVPEAVVRSHMPVTFAQMRTQDIRWESAVGNQSSWHTAGRLLKAGIKERDFVRIEAIAELLTPPLSLLVGMCLLVCLAALLTFSWFALMGSLFLIGGLLLYGCTALYLLQPPREVYQALLHAPMFVLWKLRVYFFLRKSKSAEWVRTSRTL